MAGQQAPRGPVCLLVFAAALVALLSACSSNGAQRQPATPYPGAGFDPRSVTLLPSPATGETDAARTAAGNALQALVGSSGGATQLLSPSLLSAASVVDLLRVSAGAAVAPAEARARLTTLGWSWLVTWSAVESRSAFSREWRVDLLAFGSEAGAERYTAAPILEHASLLAGGRSAPPNGSVPDAALYRAADTVAVPIALATPGPGERAVLLWRRGRIVASVSEAQTPPGLDLTSLGTVAQLLDAELVRVPGSAAP